MPRYANRQLAHVWAQRQEPHGKSNNGQFFFEGPTIYSYRTSWPVGHFVQRSGQVFALFNADTYSVTTATHTHKARVAASHYPCLSILGIRQAIDLLDKGQDRETWEHLKPELVSALSDKLLKAGRARSHAGWLMDEATRYAEQVRAFAAFLGQDAGEFSIDRFEALAAAARDNAAKQAEEARKRKAERKARDAAELAALQLTIIPNWRAGQPGTLAAWHARGGETLLRLKDPETVETSRGAEFPREHAVKAFALLQTVKGRAWQRNGQQIRLGHFQIDRIEPDGTVHAGCHVVKWPEIERLADELGLVTGVGA